MGSVWKNRIAISIFGQSHGKAIGVTLDGIPSGEHIDIEELKGFLKRRAPGRFPWSTPRKEDDEPEFLSGLNPEGFTTGSPITAVIYNTNVRSTDYEELRRIPRPGHADFAAFEKYGEYVDLSGGGHFSGRLTAPLCIAGGLCLQILKRRGVTIGAHIASIGEVQGDLFDPVTIDAQTLMELLEMDFPVINPCISPSMIAEIESAKVEQDSVGGVIECAAVGAPSGLGSPMFGGMENRIASLAFAVPAVKGIEFGAGFAAASMRGSVNNDPFYVAANENDENKQTVKTRRNCHGGILGGITSGMPIIFRTAIKPTPSIAKEQESVHLDRLEHELLSVRGRHDPCIAPRAVPCMEAVLAIAIYDATLE